MNRLLYMGDNLKVLRELKSGSVKMAYLDPPYNSGKVYRKKKGEFTDTFTKRRRSLDKAIRGKSPISADFIKLAADMHGESMAAYLQFMAIRVIEVHRILSGDGSLYYQCDDRVSHYIKAVLDCVFGAAQYRNDIVWRRAAAHNDAKRFGRILDNIFYYVKSDAAKFNVDAVRTPKSAEVKARFYTSSDKKGKYAEVGMMTHSADRYRGGKTLVGGQGVSSGESGKPWRGFNPSDHGRHWTPPRTGSYAKWIEENVIPGYTEIDGVHARLDALHDAGLIVMHEGKRKWPTMKRYEDADLDNAPQNLLLEPAGFTNYNKQHRKDEYMDYPTQKPVDLVSIFIKASSDEGDLVLDPFVGSGTTLAAAERLGRKWIGVDSSEDAINLCKRRLTPQMNQVDLLSGEGRKVIKMVKL